MKKQTLILLSLAFLVFAYIGGSYFYKSYYTKNMDFMAKQNVEVFIRPHSPIYGNENAKTYIIEFFDPACETCRDFHPFVKNIMKKYPNDLKLVLRYAPFHKDSYYVVQMLEASKLQGKYDETLAVLFKYQSNWASHHSPDIAKIWRFLPEADVDVEKLKEDMKRPEIDALIRQDIADGKTLGVTKTPQFFVNGKPLLKFGYKELQELIESEL